MIRESEYCSKIFETEFNKPFVVTKRDHEDLKILLNIGFLKKNMGWWSESKR